MKDEIRVVNCFLVFFFSQVQSIQRLNNGDNVTVIFFVTKDGQRIPAPQAAQNYNRLSKDQFARLVKLDVSSSHMLPHRLFAVSLFLPK